MDGDSDGEPYTQIDMDTTTGRPVVPFPAKRSPAPLPHQAQGNRTPPATKPRLAVQKSHSLSERGPLPPVPSLPNARGRSNTVSEVAPPPLPPKLPVAKDWDKLLEETMPKKRKKIPISDFTIDPEELNPADFVTKHQEQFPVKVRVCKGFYGHSERTSVSEGDAFNIHFVKHTKVVHVVDGGGADYNIPLNSALEFGIMYDPNDRRDEALNGFNFEKVSDLMAAKKMPQAVRTCTGYRGSGPSSTFEKNELLVIKGVKKRLNSKTLKVYCPSISKRKELPETCVGKFTTRPNEVRFFLSEIVEHMPEALPCQAMLFVHSETASELPAHLVTAVVTLTGSSIETSLIATNTEVDDFTDAPMFDIPLDLDIEFQLLHYKHKEDTEQLYSDTRTLLEHYNPVKVTSYNTSSTSNMYSIVREGGALSGIDIVKPSTIYYNVQELKEKAKGSNSSGTGSPEKATVTRDHIYEMEPAPDSVLTTQPDPKLDERLKGIEDTLQKLTSVDTTQVTRQITAARADMKRLESRTGKASEGVTELRKQLAALSTTVSMMQGQLAELSDQMKQLQGKTGGASVDTRVGYTPLEIVHPPATDTSGIYQIIPPASTSVVQPPSVISPSHTPSPVHPPVISPTTQSPAQSQVSIPDSVYEENRQFLCSLDYMQVLKLLELMGLKAYQEAFMTERINGEMLLECDDDVLLNELKVTSKLRRVRLLKLISGRHSAEQILRGEDPYVYAALR